MQNYITLFTLLLLAIVIFQDFKQRQISWFLIPLSLAAFVYKMITAKSETEWMNDLLFNIFFIVLQLLLLTLYMSIKNKKLINIVNNYLGLGDLLFFIVLSAAFSPVNFIVFYISSILLTLIGVVSYNSFTKKQIREIPLAGSMALILATLIITNKMLPQLNLYNDAYLLNVLSAL